MAGFFGLFDYSKPGKGVDKNAPQKHRFFLFFELFFRKFFKLIQLNMMYFIIILPFIAFLTYIALENFSVPVEYIQDNVLLYIFFWLLDLPSSTTGLPPFLTWILILASGILFGPATAGMTYILRNYAKQEHSWIWSDFFERLKLNFKQGVLAGVIDTLVLVSFILYMTFNPSDNSLFSQYMQLFKYVAIVVFIIYNIMRFYIYTIMVTFDLRFIAILRNSWLFVVLGILRNIFTILFCGILIAGMSFLDFVFVPLIAFSLCGFITVFNAYPVIHKFMIDPKERDQEDGSVDVQYLEDADTADDDPVFSDDVSKLKKDEQEKDD